MGKWSRPLAEAFLTWFAVPAGGRWLDIGCGTGALTAAVLAATDPTAVVGIDPSPAFLGVAQRHISDPRARFEPGDARALPVRSDDFDAVVAGLVLNFIPDPTPAVAEMVRASRPGGAIGAYVWDYQGEMQRMRYFWAAVAATDAEAASLDPRPHFHTCQPEPMTDLLRAAGLGDVAVDAIDVPMAFRDLDDFWLPHTMPGASAGQRYVSGLDDDRRAALREQLRVTLPFAADGSLHLIDRAWAVRGRKRTA
ncbi:MAG: methyltransferase domain-containing protein [Chloroflexia bacterium]|nr:methyltransferase domain-containing protein [Chloroflexia bacterium]